MKNLLQILLISSIFSGSAQVATIPITTTSLDKVALPTGFSQTGLGTNYTTPSNPSLKFDNAGDNLTIEYNSSAIYANFTLKGNPGSGAWSGTFTILESVNGITYSSVKIINSILSINAGEYFTVVLNPNSRFLKFNFTTKTNGNVALCKINISNSIPLPVTLSNFFGEEDKLFWTTESEVNNKCFEILSSPDGKIFTLIGTVQGNGTTSERQEYSHSISCGSAPYFRLRQIDYDGHYEYSELIHHSYKCDNQKNYITLEGKPDNSKQKNKLYIDTETRKKIMFIY